MGLIYFGLCFYLFFSFVAHWSYGKDNEHVMPYVSAALQSVLAWMFYLSISYCDPFAPQFPPMDNGQGMNALLQNPYMMFHPPALFTGYTALAIPFAYSVAALCYGDVTEGWLRTTRRWAIVAWVFLTIGIFLGGHWAYLELGWAAIGLGIQLKTLVYYLGCFVQLFFTHFLYKRSWDI